MKRYLIFCGESYYAKGGMADFIDSFSTQKECLEFIEEMKSNDFLDTEWVEVYDQVLGSVIYNHGYRHGYKKPELNLFT